MAASTDADIYKLLPGGEILNRVGYNEEWTNNIMYCSTLYLKSELEIHPAHPTETQKKKTQKTKKKK